MCNAAVCSDPEAWMHNESGEIPYVTGVWRRGGGFRLDCHEGKRGGATKERKNETKVKQIRENEGGR